jgi:hypothetical protein
MRAKRVLFKVVLALAVATPVMLLSDSAGAVSNIVPVANTFLFNGIACQSASTCWSLGYTGSGELVPVVDGVPGTPVTVPSVTLWDIACPSSTACYAVGTDGDISNPPQNDEGVVVPILNGVVEPAILAPGTNDLYGIACYTSTQCVAVGDEVFSLTLAPYHYGVTLLVDNGSPGAATPVTNTWDLYGAACETPEGACIAVGLALQPDLKFNAGVVPVNDGVNGTTQSITSLSGLTKVSCTTTTQCYAVGSNGVVSIVSQTAGTIKKKKGVADYYGLSCPSATKCQLVGETSGDTAFVESLSKGSPGKVISFSGTAYLNGIACVTISECIGAGAEPFNGDYQGILVTAAAPLPALKIKKVTFTGSKTNPTITIEGSNFSDWAPPGDVPGCTAGTGLDYGSNGLLVGDLTQGWGAGTDGDCVGLVVTTWTNTKIIATYGSNFSDYANPMKKGDAFQVVVEGTTFTGTAKVS